MKKIVALFFLFAAGSRILCYAQLNDRKSRELFIIGKSFIYITNDFIKQESISKESVPKYSKPVEAFYTVTGPELDVTAMGLDSTSVLRGRFSVNGSWFFDSSSALFDFSRFQVRVSENNRPASAWQNVKSFSFFYDSIITSKKNANSYTPAYRLVHQDININDSVTVEIRQADGMVYKNLIKLHIKRVPLLLIPFLAKLTHDSSVNHSADVFIQQELSDWPYKSPDVDIYCKNWPGIGVEMQHQKYYPSSKLAFYFRKADGFPDSSLEYRLTGGAYDDTTWHLSGHLILVPHMQVGADYSLLVRYKNSSNVSRYTFYVPPTWFQKYRYFFIYILSFLAVFFAIVLVAGYRVKKANAKRATLALQLKNIRSQLNPHFVFNALSSIQALINKSEVDLANQYLTEFSSLLRDSLQNHDSDYVPLAVEIKMLENYIRLEQLRFNFKYTIAVNGEVDTNTTEIPLMLLQPLVENAIKHGISALKEEGELSIAFRRVNNSLLISITDNGMGFNPQAAFGNQHGLRLTKERVGLLNRGLKKQCIIFAINSKPANTTVEIEFDNWM